LQTDSLEKLGPSRDRLNLLAFVTQSSRHIGSWMTVAIVERLENIMQRTGSAIDVLHEKHLKHQQTQRGLRQLEALQ
jgi:hypothetical protein